MAVKIERIFCPVDLQNQDEKSLLLPFKLAEDFGAKVFLFFGVTKLSSEDFGLNRLKLKGLAENLFDISAKESGNRMVEYETIVIEAKNIAAEIVIQAAKCQADLIVMQSSRQTSLKELLLGSIIETVCRNAPCSVLVAPSKTTGWKNEISFNRILAAHDFSAYSELALQTAIFFNEKYAGRLHLLHVLAEPLVQETELAWSIKTVESLYHQTVNRLQTAMTGRKRKENQIFFAVRWGKTYKEILKYGEENNIDLVTMGAHGLDFEAHTLFGSNVDRVLRQSPCAVLIAHPLKPFYMENKREISLPAA